MTRIAHLSSVHNCTDTRIFHKECKSLARAGYDVFLVVQEDGDKEIEGVKIKAVPRPRSRIDRIVRTVPAVYRTAKALEADVYHFHDPELIPVGMLLALGGAKVIYDIHEDYITSILQKDYFPAILRTPLAYGCGFLESLVSKVFTIVLAERYYADRFPGGAVVCNYPVDPTAVLGKEGDPRPSSEGDQTGNPKELSVIYTGTLSDDRGAYAYAHLARIMEEVRIHVVGSIFPSTLEEEMFRLAGEGRDRVILAEREGDRVPFTRIVEAYNERSWVAGLALFPRTPHYLQKELTKFFEYMAAGIPIVCSDFPTWRRLVEENGFGLCVDPTDPEKAAEAIRYLADHPEEAKEMGRRGRRAVKERFNWDSEARKLEALYERILKGEPRGGRVQPVEVG